MADGLKSSMFSISEEVIKNCVVEEGVEEAHAVQLFYNVLLFFCHCFSVFIVLL